MKSVSSQRASIKKFLEDGYSLTALEALSLFGAYRLAAHIHVLRLDHGMPIIKQMLKDVTGRTYARYSLPVGGLGRVLAMFQAPRSPLSHQKEIVYHA